MSPETTGANNLFEQKKIAMRDFMRQAHGAQKRNARVPYWLHPQEVAEILLTALQKTDEAAIDPALTTDMFLAAQGHDLYEDTKASRQEVQEKFGQQVDEFINNLTNRQGDQDRVAYVKQIAAAPEEVKMIKLSDMIENMTSVAYSIQEVGVKWADDFFLPIMNEIKPVVEGAQYVRFKKTSALLIEMMQSAYDRLQRILAIWKLI